MCADTQEYDFSGSPVNITVPADSRTFQIPSSNMSSLITINDDNIDEDEQSYAIVAEIEQDVPDGISCFMIAEGATTCFGRRGATEIRITDNDRKLPKGYKIIR